MRSLKDYILESNQEDQSENQFLLDTWLKGHPEEIRIVNELISTWESSRQFNDDLLKKWLDKTDVRALYDCLSGSAKPYEKADDYYGFIKNFIKNIR